MYLYLAAKCVKLLVQYQLKMFEWVSYELESIAIDYYMKPDSVSETGNSKKKANSYCSYALDLCILNSPLEKLKLKYICIDHCWRNVTKNVKDDVTFEYAQLLALVKLLLSMSHGNCPR